MSNPTQSGRRGDPNGRGPALCGTPRAERSQSRPVGSPGRGPPSSRFSQLASWAEGPRPPSHGGRGQRPRRRRRVAGHAARIGQRHRRSGVAAARRRSAARAQRRPRRRPGQRDQRQDHHHPPAGRRPRHRSTVVSNSLGANMPPGHVAALGGKAAPSATAVLEVDERWLGTVLAETARRHRGAVEPQSRPARPQPRGPRPGGALARGARRHPAACGGRQRRRPAGRVGRDGCAAVTCGSRPGSSGAATPSGVRRAARRLAFDDERLALPDVRPRPPSDSTSAVDADGVVSGRRRPRVAATSACPAASTHQRRHGARPPQSRWAPTREPRRARRWRRSPTSPAATARRPSPAPRSDCCWPRTRPAGTRPSTCSRRRRNRWSSSINARIADGHDPSWLWDVPFERLAGRLVVGHRRAPPRSRGATALRRGRSRRRRDVDRRRCAGVRACHPRRRPRRQLHRVPGVPHRVGRLVHDAWRLAIGRCASWLLFPELLGTYGDGGNAIGARASGSRGAGIDAEVIEVAAGDAVPDIRRPLPARRRRGRAPGRRPPASSAQHGPLHRAVERGAAVFAVCAGMQIVGDIVPRHGRRARSPGAGLLDCETVKADRPRAVGELLVHRRTPGLRPARLTGFENHGGRTGSGPTRDRSAPVEVGDGNGDGTEGAVNGRACGRHLPARPGAGPQPGARRPAARAGPPATSWSPSTTPKRTRCTASVCAPRAKRELQPRRSWKDVIRRG